VGVEERSWRDGNLKCDNEGGGKEGRKEGRKEERKKRKEKKRKNGKDSEWELTASSKERKRSAGRKLKARGKGIPLQRVQA